VVPPAFSIENVEAMMSKQYQQLLNPMSVCSAEGSGTTVKKAVEEFIDCTGADDLMLVCSIFDHEKRVRSFQMVAEMMGRKPDNDKELDE